MEFEWDAQKEAINREKHGVSFEAAIEIFAGTVFEKPDSRDHGGENRMVAFGTVGNRLLAVVYTWRGDICRIISARKANEREQRAYHAAFSRVVPKPDG